MRIKLLIKVLLIVVFIGQSLCAQEVSPVKPPEYRFQVRLISVVDGDTLEADVFLPFGIGLFDQRIRVLGVDTWEVSGEEKPKGLIAKEYTDSFTKSGTVWIAPVGKRQRDNFGRLLAKVYVVRDGVWRELSAELISNGHGVKAGE
jgi:endonuclease YncB( thermonuclease family)